MTTATTFPRQNDAGSRAYTTLENLVLVVVLVLESKGLRYFKLNTEPRVPSPVFCSLMSLIRLHLAVGMTAQG